MSVYGNLDTDVQEQVGTNQGWSDFGTWADKLDHGRYEEVVRLWEHGQCENLDGLERQLLTALRRDPPPHEDVRSVAQAILDLLAARGDAEVLTVSNGLVPTDGDDDADELQEVFVRSGS